MSDPSSDIPERRVSSRILGWMLLVIILAVFAALYFFGFLPGGVVSYAPK